MSAAGAKELIEISRRLCRATDRLRFGPPVTHVYNPLDYARLAHEAYLRRWGQGRKPVLLLGMNPGPFGMAQTGVPFGPVDLARELLGIEEPLIACPWPEHPKRPVLGFDCQRSEVSGQRIWGWVRRRFGEPERFFQTFLIVNYCPLVFLEASGRNRTPDKLRKAEREPLFEVCDRALRETVAALEAELVVGIGRFSEQRALAVLDDHQVRIGRVLHPSPANPAANKGWTEGVEVALRALGVELPEAQ